MACSAHAVARRHVSRPLPLHCRCPLSDPRSPSPFSKSNPEQKPKQEKAVKLPKPWDRPTNWPEIGDPDDNSLYNAVGRALSSWEVYEGYLSLLFGVFIDPSSDGRRAKRAFCSIRTHEGRLDMLTAAAKAYFVDFSSPELLNDFETLRGPDLNWSGRRNDIAHGCVQPFWDPVDFTVCRGGYFLVPSYANYKDRNISGTPEYALVSSNINTYALGFESLYPPICNMITSIQSKSFT